MTIRQILTNIYQAGQVDGMGETLDHDKEWHLEQAEKQLKELGASDENNRPNTTRYNWLTE